MLVARWVSHHLCRSSKATKGIVNALCSCGADSRVCVLRSASIDHLLPGKLSLLFFCLFLFCFFEETNYRWV